MERSNLVIVERDVPAAYHLDVSVPLIRVRHEVWEAMVGAVDIFDVGITSANWGRTTP